jgi:hypothetical protein
MRLTTCGIVMVLLALTLFPITAEAFGRRPGRSEVAQGQGQPGPLNDTVQNHNDSSGRPPQSVPEPSTLLLVGMGLALMFIVSKKKPVGQPAHPGR